MEKEQNDRNRVGSALRQEEEDQIRHGRVQEQATNWIQEALISKNVAEVRCKKDQLLAKMREIDDQNHVTQKAMLGRYSPLFLPILLDRTIFTHFYPHRNGGSVHYTS